jgi:hypothetical protein
MGKKIRISGYMWGLMMTLILGAIFIFISHQKIESSKQEMSNYTTSEFCATEFNCRQIVNAMVLKSTSTKRMINSGGNKWGSTGVRKSVNVNFYVTIKDQNNQVHEIHIIPKAAADLEKVNTPEGFEYLYIGENENFAENSFPVGSQISLEIWHGKATALFSQFINSPAGNTQEFVFVVPNGLGPFQNNSGQTSISEVRENEAVVIPTTENPIMIYSNSVESYEQTKIAVGFLSMILLTLSFITHKK